MSFRYIVETINRNGLKETAVQEYDKQEILLGRGASCDILLTGRRVSLSHAKISLREGEAHVEDLESLSGVLVNRKLVRHQKLRAGDVVQIGGYELEVVKEGASWGVLERRNQSLQDDGNEKLVQEQERSLRFQTYLPSFTILSTLISLIVLVLFGALPLSGAKRMPWNSGPISNPHRMIAEKCEQCHQTPFVRVQDTQCAACHSMSEHAKNISKVFESHPQLDARCATCHMEHNGDEGLIAKSSKLCTECHGKLESIFPATEVKEIRSFEAHPEFRVALPATDPGQQPERVSLSDKQKLVDGSAIKLNHELHLKEGLTGAEGPVTLACHDCHRPDAKYQAFKPINFERDCQACHPLDFDARLPGKSVPHGDAEVVYNFLYAEYAKLFLATEGAENPLEASNRRRPGGATVERGDKVEFSRSSVESESRSMEESLFTRTACHLCHMVSKSDAAGEGEAGVQGQPQGSLYRVLPPNIPELWMSKARFDHGAHQEISCESCHKGVRSSKETTDVLLPGIEGCRDCHAQDAKTDLVQSDCVMCHSYHDPLVMPDDDKRAIERILFSDSGERNKFYLELHAQLRTP